MQRLSMKYTMPSSEGHSRKVIVVLASKDTKCNYNNDAQAYKECRTC